MCNLCLSSTTANDYLTWPRLSICTEGVCKKRLQQSVDRVFVYVYADKLGTQYYSNGKPCMEGNYAPAWTTSQKRYQVLGKWPENLWKQYKLSNECYDTYRPCGYTLFRLSTSPAQIRLVGPTLWVYAVSPVHFASVVPTCGDRLSFGGKSGDGTSRIPA